MRSLNGSLQAELRTWLPTKRLLIVFIALVVSLNVVGTALAGTANDDFIEQPDKSGELGFEAAAKNAAEPFATIEVSKDMSLKFFMVPGHEGRPAGVMVSELTRNQYPGVRSHSDLANATPMDVFVAYSPPGTALPRELIELDAGRKKDSVSLGQQGWARDPVLVNPGGTQYFACQIGSEPWNSFADEVTDFGYAGLFLSEADGPSTRPEHWYGMPGPGDGTGGWMKLQGSAYDVWAFFAKVSYCFEDHNNPSSYHGRNVSISYRNSLNSPWAQIQSEQLMDVGDEASFFWHPVDEPVPGYAPSAGVKNDFRLEISMVRDIDQFHIGATWSKPDAYLAY